MPPFCGLPTFHHTCKLKRSPFHKIRYRLKKHRIFAFCWFFWFPTEWLETLKKTLNPLNLINRFNIDWICIDLFSTMFHPSTSSSLWVFGPVATFFQRAPDRERASIMLQLGCQRLGQQGWCWRVPDFTKIFYKGNFKVGGTSSKLKLCSYSSLFDLDHWP